MKQIWLKNFRVDPRSLALFRILISLVLIGDWLARWRHVEAFYTSAGVFPNALRFQLTGDSLRLLPLDWFDSPLAVQFIFVAALVCYLALLVGFGTRLFSVLSLMFLVSIGRRNDLVLIGADQVLVTMLLWGVFLPLGRRFSVDAWLWRRRPAPLGDPDSPTSDSPENTIVSLAGFAAVLQIALIYFCTAMAKSGVTWHDGTAMYYTLHMDQSNQALALWLRELPIGMLKAFTWSALFLEFAAAPLILSPWWQPGLRRVAIVSLSAMHLVIALSLNAGTFSFVMMASYSLLLSDSDWRLLRRGGQRLATWPIFRRIAGSPAVRSGVEIPQQRSSPVGDRPSLESGRMARVVAIVQNGAVLLLLMVTLATAFNSNIAPRWFTEGIPLPRAAGSFVSYLGVRQQWIMFAPDAPRNDGWWVIDGVSENRTRWDPLAEAPPSFEKPPRNAARHGVLWRSYLKRVWLRAEDADQPHLAELRKYGGRYLANLTDAENDRDATAATPLHFFYVQEFTRPPGTPQPFPTQTIDLGSYDPLADQYLAGNRPVLWTYWHADGRRAMQGSYKDNQKTGVWKHWDAAGQLREEGSFRMGLPHGPWATYHADGSQETGTYDHGQKHGLWTYRHANGQRAEEGEFKGGRRNGVWNRWDRGGQIRQQSELSDEVPHGLTITWDENGQKISQGQYDQGQATGPWEYWHPHGRRRMTGSFRSGAREGAWQSWYANGQQESSGNYVSGRKEGVWTIWSEDGSQRQEVTFRRGRPVQPHE